MTGRSEAARSVHPYRIDLAYDGMSPPKLLEYNADTPTALVEASVVQWHWLQEVFPRADQFNSIHDKLVATWKDFGDWIPQKSIAFTSADSVEDGFTLAYLQETAAQAGFATDSFPISELGWNGKEFVSGNANVAVPVVFKLYPWEWLLNDEFGAHLTERPCQMFEPAWKMTLSNKGLLAVLWRMFEGHPNLLPAYFEDDPAARSLIGGGAYARKPIFGREGANVELIGAAHLALNHKDGFAELGLSVNAGERRHGYGLALLQRAKLHAVNRGFRTFFMCCLSENRTMVHLALVAGLKVAVEQGEVDAHLRLEAPNIGGVALEAVEDQMALIDLFWKQQLQWFPASVRAA